MPRKPNQTPIVCEFFTWRLLRRDGVLYADGRAAARDLGKHSLGTRDRAQALDNLRQLDRQKAIELGLTSAVSAPSQQQLSITSGWTRYLDWCGRSEIMGGASASSIKRYRAVRDKHQKFVAQRGLAGWQDFDKTWAERYGNWLNKEGYAPRTIFLELTLLKSVIRWLVDEKHLPPACLIRLPLRKPQGTDTYCYAPNEVSAMIVRCRAVLQLGWLADVIMALATTGLRISELAALRWSDVDLRSNTIRVTDERASARKRQLGPLRTTKGRRSRTVPIHPDLLPVLVAIGRHRDGRVFHGQRGGVLRPNNVREAFIREVIDPLAKRFPTPAGEIGFDHGRLHGFRHFFCSQAFLGGASEGEIRGWLGHQESKMVEHYRHLRADDSQRKMKQIDFLGREGGTDCPNGVA